MDFLLAQLPLIAFNCYNALIDAYRITRHKNIAHAINFIAYLICCALCVWLYDIPLYGEAILFLFSAFFNRQLTFDIPINWRRNLPWYYQSTATPPKALMDRIERQIFGRGEFIGKYIAWAYVTLWCVCINIKIWLLW